MVDLFRAGDLCRTLRCVTLALTAGAAAVLAMNAVSANAAGQDSVSALDARPPLVVAHRGASGYLPEEAPEAFQPAVDQGADVIEFDLISTGGGVLMARHDVDLAVGTDVAGPLNELSSGAL